MLDLCFTVVVLSNEAFNEEPKNKWKTLKMEMGWQSKLSSLPLPL